MPSSIKIPDGQLLNVILARLRNGRFEAKGEKEGADELLFDPVVQRKCNQKPEFWYAQVFVAALQNKGFHLAFLTANETKMLTPYSDKQDQKIIDVDTMVAFFKSYRDNPLYARYRDKIERLIKFYEGDALKNPFEQIDERHFKTNLYTLEGLVSDSTHVLSLTLITPQHVHASLANTQAKLLRYHQFVTPLSKILLAIAAKI